LLEIIRDVVIIYFKFELVEQSPYQIDDLLSSISKTRQTTIIAHDYLGNSEPISIGLALDLELQELLSSELASLNAAPRTNNSLPHYSAQQP
jgi:hypothetical protein